MFASNSGVIGAPARASRRALAALVVVVALAAALALVGLGQAAGARADTAPPSGVTPTVAADTLPTVQVDGVVWSQVVVGNTVYATGSFSYARPAGTPVGDPSQVVRSNLLAYDITTGNLITSFAHSLNAQGLVVTASPDGSTVYVGGDFSIVDGVTRQHIAAFSTATGALLPNFRPSVASEVRAIAATNSTVYIGGNFLQVNGSAVSRLAAVTASTGALLSWAPSADDNIVNALLVSPDGSTVVVAGKFTTLNGLTRRGIGAVDATTGASAPWNPSFPMFDNGDNAGFTALTTDGTHLIGSAYNFGSNGGAGNFEGRFSSDFAGNVYWMDSCHGDSYSVFVQGQVLYEVGHSHDCSDVGAWEDTSPRTWHRALAETLTPSGTLAHNNNGGYTDFYGQPANHLLHWFPTLTGGTYTGQGQAAWSVSGNSDYVVMGGEFPKVNNVAQQGLVRFAVTSKAPNKVGPFSTATMTPTVVSNTAGVARVSWGSTWDPDNATLTYKVYRDASTTPIYTVTQSSNFWMLPTLTYFDRGLVPGSTHTYKVKAFDPFNNPISSPGTTSVTVASTGSSGGVYSQDVTGAGASDYWRLGEASGTTAYDSAGGLDLAVGSGVTRGVAGALNNDTDTASSFNGTSTGVAASGAVYQPATTISVSAWVKAGSVGFSGGKIVGLGNVATGTSSSSDDNLYFDNAGHLLFGALSNGSARAVASSSTYNDNAWHQVIGVVGADGMSLYVDGRRVARDQSVTSVAPISASYWRVGGDSLNGWPSKPSSSYVKASIDEVAVYPAALTLAQVQTQYTDSGRTLAGSTAPADNYGAAVYNAGPDLFWRLDGTAGPTVADASPNGNTGTAAGGVTFQTPSTVTTSGTAATFNGSNGTIGSQQSFVNPITYSEQAWFKTTTTHGGKIIGFGSARSGNSSNYDRHVYMLNSGQLVFGVYTGSMVTVQSAASFNDGKWHQVVATQGANGMVLYVDGAAVGTNPTTTAQNYNGYWRVGGDTSWGGDSGYFSGAIDEAAVFPTALSPAQVLSMYQASPAAVNRAPVAAYSYTCTSAFCSFDGSASSDPDGTVSNWSWNFGDGSAAATGAKVNHSFPGTGSYSVTLTVTDNSGATTTTTQSVSVVQAANQPPTAAFTQACTAFNCTFDGSGSADSDGTIASYAWDFGDGSTGSGATPSHTYTVAGDYPVTLTVTDNNGATTAVSHTATPAPPANPDTSPFAADQFNRTTATGWGAADTGGSWTTSGTTSVTPGSGLMSLATGGSGNAYLGSVSRSDTDLTATAATNQLPTGGGQYVYLVGRRVATNTEYRAVVHLNSTGKVGVLVTDLAGSSTENVLKSETTAAGITYTAGMKLDVRFQVTGTGPTALRAKVWVHGTAEPASWLINVTDSTAPLQATGGVGVRGYLSGSATSATVFSVSAFSASPTNTPPVGAFTPSCTGLTCQVDASASTDPQNDIANYQWSFGDGATASGVTSSHSYSQAGTYRITVTVTDSRGLTSVVRQSVTVA